MNNPVPPRNGSALQGGALFCSTKSFYFQFSIRFKIYFNVTEKVIETNSVDLDKVKLFVFINYDRKIIQMAQN